MEKQGRSLRKAPLEDRVFYLLSGIFLVVFTIAVLYPLIYIVSSSFSSGAAVGSGRVILWPVDPGLEGYKAVFKHRHIVTGYRNTIFYTAVGTFINVMMTLFAAYPLSRRDMQFKKGYMFLFVFTMYFSGGLIPSYILMTQIHFIDTIWAMIIPGALSVYNMILVRSFIMSSIPGDLLEVARIDGCSDIRYFFQIVLPLSKAIIAVVTLFYAVAHWNAYFNALIYLNDPRLQPLQLTLRTILIANKINLSDIVDPEIIAAQQGLADLLKYSLIVVSTAPILAIYPFVQKYFVKGVMIGSIKG